MTIEEQNSLKLGALIKTARLNLNMSLRQLSTLSNVNYKTIHKIENSQIKKIDPTVLVHLSSILNTDLVKMLVLAGYFELVFRLKYEVKNERDK